VPGPSGFVTLPTTMGVYAELRGFVLTHRECGVLRGATKPIDQGFRLAVICPCGARFLRSVVAAPPPGEAPAQRDVQRDIPPSPG